MWLWLPVDDNILTSDTTRLDTFFLTSDTTRLDAFTIWAYVGFLWAPLAMTHEALDSLSGSPTITPKAYGGNTVGRKFMRWWSYLSSGWYSLCNGWGVFWSHQPTSKFQGTALPWRSSMCIWDATSSWHALRESLTRYCGGPQNRYQLGKEPPFRL